MSQAGTAAPSLAVAIVVLAWVLYRQLTTRPLRKQSWAAIILILVGGADTVQFTSRITPSARDAGFLLLSAVVGAGLASVRGLTVRIWADGDQVLRRGTILTALLWLISIAQHIVIGRLASDGLASATLLLYFGLVLAVQQQVLLVRARSQGLFPVSA